MNDYVLLEMRMAELMAQQEASGFRFDVSAAERVRGELQEEAAQLEQTITSRFVYVPGKVYTPKRANKTKGKRGMLSVKGRDEDADWQPKRSEREGGQGISSDAA